MHHSQDLTTYLQTVHALDWYKSNNNQYPNNIVLLQPTSPFRSVNDIEKAVKLFINSRKKRLISACELMQHPNDCLIQNDDGSYKRIEVGLKSSSHSWETNILQNYIC